MACAYSSGAGLSGWAVRKHAGAAAALGRFRMQSPHTGLGWEDYLAEQFLICQFPASGVALRLFLAAAASFPQSV